MRRIFSIILCFSFFLSLHVQGAARESHKKLSHKQKQELIEATPQGDIQKLREILSPTTAKSIDNARTFSFLPKQSIRQNKLIAKSSWGWNPKSKKTSHIVYETYNGIMCHIGLYSDVCIATALNGPETGNQYIVNKKGILVSTSSEFVIVGNHVVHIYGWGHVYSYKASKQEIKVKK